MYDIEHLKTQFKSDIIKSFQEDNDKSLKDIIKEKVNQFYVILNKEKYLKKTDQIYITISDQQEAINYKERNYNFCLQIAKSSEVKQQESYTFSWKRNIFYSFIISFGIYPIINVQVAKKRLYYIKSWLHSRLIILQYTFELCSCYHLVYFYQNFTLKLEEYYEIPFSAFYIQDHIAIYHKEIRQVYFKDV